MEIDIRYVSLIAKTVPFKSNKWLGRVGYIGAAVIVVGAFFLFNAINYPIDSQPAKVTAVSLMNKGTIISIVGLIIAATIMALKNRERKLNMEKFLEYFEKNHALPPWPEQKTIKVKNR